MIKIVNLCDVRSYYGWYLWLIVVNCPVTEQNGSRYSIPEKCGPIMFRATHSSSKQAYPAVIVRFYFNYISTRTKVFRSFSLPLIFSRAVIELLNYWLIKRPERFLIWKLYRIFIAQFALPRTSWLPKN